MIAQHPSYVYAKKAVDGIVNVPKYVKKQCADFIKIADGNDEKYCIDETRVFKIDKLLSDMVMPKGLKAGSAIRDVTLGHQWLFYIAVLCTVYKDNADRRRYETAVMEVARKNLKTFTVATTFILLLLLEPKYSKLYSVAPDGSIARELKEAIEEIIKSSPFLYPEVAPEMIFKMRRDYITCALNGNKYVPLNYSNSRLDSRLPSAFLVDEAGALPNNYAIEAMQSGQLTILNKLGCIISTKYPTSTNPFEGEVAYSKKVLDGLIADDTRFALLYEPDDTKNWATDDTVLEHANPAALEIPEIMADIKKKRARAIEREEVRENFLTKHCNIVYQGIGTECYIPIDDLKKCRMDSIDWAGRDVYVGVDLAMTTDNCAVAFVTEVDGDVYAKLMAFVPEGRIDEKNATERINYWNHIRAGECIACGDKIIDYAVIEDFVLDLEKSFGVNVLGIGYDRYNAMSSAQKWERGRDEEHGYDTVIVRQHSDTLHPPTKLLAELVAEGRFHYEPNKLFEINMENARCTFDTNMNRYVNKKRSNGKVDMVVALINAMFLLQQNVYFGCPTDWVIQTA